MHYYINGEDQKEIEKLLLEYQEITQGGEIITLRSEQVMTKLFNNYFDKIIMGIIFAQHYRFWRFAEVDDLLQEARVAIIASIHKNQFDRLRGNVFNFFSTVVSKNLQNYTKKQNKYLFNGVEQDINDIFNEENAQYDQDYHKNLVLEEAFKAMHKFFEGKKKFMQLTDLLERYYRLNIGKKFVKKKFIAYAKSYNISPASSNNFFAFLKRMKLLKEVKTLLEI